MALNLHAIDAMLSTELRLLDGVEVDEGLSNSSQDNLTHWLISTQLGATLVRPNDLFTFAIDCHSLYSIFPTCSCPVRPF